MLTKVIALVGASHTDNFSRSNHVLLCKTPRGRKFEAALKWGLPIVTVDWLYRSVAKVVLSLPLLLSLSLSQHHMACLTLGGKGRVSFVCGVCHCATRRANNQQQQQQRRSSATPDGTATSTTTGRNVAAAGQCCCDVSSACQGCEGSARQTQAHGREFPSLQANKGSVVCVVGCWWLCQRLSNCGKPEAVVTHCIINPSDAASIKTKMGGVAVVSGEWIRECFLHGARMSEDCFNARQKVLPPSPSLSLSLSLLLLSIERARQPKIKKEKYSVLAMTSPQQGLSSFSLLLSSSSCDYCSLSLSLLIL